ncbi:tyrosine-protein phosphatase [Glaciecola sp. 1036]|uniref:tyrosine-protein phosphatase n=1 Tax=Alteromonadaceae TaxID=72275 RepID=UPI003D06E9BA
MIDLHSHILPGIDDGASSIEETLALARQSVDAGVTHMMCTPHVNLGIFDNDKSSIEAAFEVACREIAAAKIPLKLAYAAEVRICPEVTTLLGQDKLMFIGEYEGKRALLLELPHSHIPAGTDTLVRWLLKQNIQPIIPHPERNREILEQYEKVIWLKKLGCIFQLTAGALTGSFRNIVREAAWQMLEDKLICYIASDIHNLHKRPNDMGLAYTEVKNEYGESTAQNLFVNIPRKLTERIQWK